MKLSNYQSKHDYFVLRKIYEKTVLLQCTFTTVIHHFNKISSTRLTTRQEHISKQRLVSWSRIILFQILISFSNIGCDRFGSKVKKFEYH